MGILIYLGDGLWILSLSIMAGASRQAWNRMTPDTMVPISFKPDGSPHVRARRRLALTLMPGVAFVVSLLLVVRNRNLGLTGDEAFILFGVRATRAAMFPLAHLRWLKAALTQLEAEGALKS